MHWGFKFVTFKSLTVLRETVMPNREREHAAMLRADFSPRGGWWQENARGEKK